MLVTSIQHFGVNCGTIAKTPGWMLCYSRIQVIFIFTSSFNDVLYVLNILVSLIIRHACGTNRQATFLLHKPSTKIWRIFSLLTPNWTAIILAFTPCSSYIRFLNFEMSPSLRIENGRPGLSSSSIAPTPHLNRAYHLNICARDKQLSPYTFLINSTASATVFPEFKTEFIVRSLLYVATVTTSSHYLHSMAPYFLSGSAWGVAVLPDYRWRLVTWMACIAS